MSQHTRSAPSRSRTVLVLAAAAALAAVVLPATPAFADGSPQGMVAFFNGSQCPSGWNAASYASGRLVVAVTEGNLVKKTVGTPLADREDRTHTHSYSTNIDLSHNSISGASGCCNDQGAKDTDSNTASGTTKPSTSNYPFTQLVICERG